MKRKNHFRVLCLLLMTAFIAMPLPAAAEHAHDFSGQPYEYFTQHPHDEYQMCKEGCGTGQLTGRYGWSAGCSICNPPHVHDFSGQPYEYFTQHPHDEYQMCKAYDGAGQLTGGYGLSDDCSVCNPPHA